MISETTIEHYELFKRTCEATIDLLQLSDWWIYYEWTDLELDRIAEITTDPDAKQATIRFGKKWENWSFVTDHEITATAVHEVLHILTAEITELAAKAVSDRVAEKEEHAIINRLTRILMESIDGND